MTITTPLRGHCFLRGFLSDLRFVVTSRGSETLRYKKFCALAVARFLPAGNVPGQQTSRLHYSDSLTEYFGGRRLSTDWHVAAAELNSERFYTTRESILIDAPRCSGTVLGPVFDETSSVFFFLLSVSATDTRRHCGRPTRYGDVCAVRTTKARSSSVEKVLMNSANYASGISHGAVVPSSWP